MLLDTSLKRKYAKCDALAIAQARSAEVVKREIAKGNERTTDQHNLSANVSTTQLSEAELAVMISVDTSDHEQVGDITTASIEMNAVAVRNTRCKDPVCHFILSWPEHERPDPAAIFDAAEHAIDSIGLADHQYVIAVHANTDNIHCHVAVSRINPNTYRSRNIEWAQKSLHIAARQSEIKHRWSHDNGIYVVETDGHGKKHIVLNKGQAEALAKSIPHAHRDLENEAILPTWHDPDSLDSWLKTKVARALKHALPDIQSWHGLHAWLSHHDITLTDTGGGGMRLHAISPETGEVLDVAASQGLRILKRRELQKRWGKFVNSIPVPCIVPDLSHLAADQVAKAVEDFLTTTLDAGIPSEHFVRAQHHTNRDAVKKSSGLPELPFGWLDAGRQNSALQLLDGIHDDLESAQTGQDPDVRRPGGTEPGSRSERSLTRDDSKRAERKAQRAAARADLRQRFSQYKRLVRAGDSEYFKRAKEVHAERSHAQRQIREQSKVAKAAIPKGAALPVRLITIYEIDAESIRRKLQAEAIFQEKSRALRTTRSPPVSWRAWLFEQSNLGDQAALSALRGIVYQAQRDAKGDKSIDDSEVLAVAGTAEYREQQFRAAMARLLEEEKKEAAIRSASSNTMRPYEVDAILARYVGIWWLVTGNGNVEYSDEGGGHLFTDRGNRVTFDRIWVSDDEIRLALVHAKQKFGNQLALTGDDPVFTARMARLADDMGMTILNPELRPVIVAHQAARTLQITEAVTLRPAGKAPAAPNMPAQREPLLQGREATTHADGNQEAAPRIEVLAVQTPQERLRAMVLSIDPSATFVIPDPSNSQHPYIGPVVATLEGSDTGFAQHAGSSVYALHPINAPEHHDDAVIEVQYRYGQAVIVDYAPSMLDQQAQRETTPAESLTSDAHQVVPAPEQSIIAKPTKRKTKIGKVLTTAPVASALAAGTLVEAVTEESISVHVWFEKWVTEAGKKIDIAMPGKGDVTYVVVHVAHDGVALDKGRSGAVYPVPADLLLQVGDKVIVGSNGELRLPNVPAQGSGKNVPGR